MFAINSFVSDKGSSKGQTVKTVMIGTNPDPRKNQHIGPALAASLYAILSDPKAGPLFSDALRAIGNVEVPAAPAPVPVVAPVPTPTPSNPPKMTTEETIRSIQESKTVPTTDRAGEGKDSRKTTTAMQPTTATVPSATINIAVSEFAERASLIAEGRSLGMRAIQAYGHKMDLVKLRDKVAAKRATSKPETPETPVKPETPETPVKPETHATEETPSPATKAAKRVLVTMSLGEDNNVYAIYRTAEGTLVAVADIVK